LISFPTNPDKVTEVLSALKETRVKNFFLRGDTALNEAQMRQVLQAIIANPNINNIAERNTSRLLPVLDSMPFTRHINVIIRKRPTASRGSHEVYLYNMGTVDNVINYQLLPRDVSKYIFRGTIEGDLYGERGACFQIESSQLIGKLVPSGGRLILTQRGLNGSTVDSFKLLIGNLRFGQPRIIELQLGANVPSGVEIQFKDGTREIKSITAGGETWTQ